MSKILITGASGFVGSWLVKEALGRGLHTFAAIRSTSSRAYLQDDRINIVELDFEDEESISTILKEHQFDYIIHNAGITRTQKDSTYFHVNATYTERLAQLSAKHLSSSLKKFVFISSIEAFGSADGTPENVVNHSIQPRPRTTYGRSKLKAEELLGKVQGLPLIILRPTAVFGPAERDLFQVWETIKKFRFIPTLGYGEKKYSFVYVKDLVRVVLDASLSSVTGRQYFVSDSRLYVIKDFTSAIAQSLNISPLRVTIPHFLLDSIVFFTRIKDRITGQKSLLNDEQLAKIKARNWDCDISDLVEDFNYFPKYNLQEAVKETTDWYLEQKWL